LTSATDISKIRKELAAASVRRYGGSYILGLVIAVSAWLSFKWGSAAYEFAVVRGLHLKTAITQYFSS